MASKRQIWGLDKKDNFSRRKIVKAALLFGFIVVSIAFSPSGYCAESCKTRGGHELYINASTFSVLDRSGKPTFPGHAHYYCDLLTDLAECKGKDSRWMLLEQFVESKAMGHEVLKVSQRVTLIKKTIINYMVLCLK